MSKIKIIQAINENNSRDLMKALYKTSLPPIVKYIKQKGGTKNDAEDCFQEAVIMLVKKVKLKEYDESFEVKNFLFIVARNLWYNKLKKHSRTYSIEVEELDLADETLNIDQRMFEQERQSAIHKLLNSAGERCVELLKLILFENKKLKEVAEIVGASSDEVVKTNSYRCKKKLKEKLKSNPSLMSILKP